MTASGNNMTSSSDREHYRGRKHHFAFVFSVTPLGILLSRLIWFWLLKSKNSNPLYHVLEYKFQFQSSELTMRIPEEKKLVLALWKYIRSWRCITNLVLFIVLFTKIIKRFCSEFQICEFCFKPSELVHYFPKTHPDVVIIFSNQ